MNRVQSFKSDFAHKIPSRFYNANHEKWLNETLLQNTRLVIEPKIEGIGINLFYENGMLIKAVTNTGLNQSKVVRSSNLVSEYLPISNSIQIQGIFYLGLKNDKVRNRKINKNLKSFLKINNVNFCAFHILNSDLNHSSQLIALKKLSFNIPDSEQTKSTKQISLYRHLWKRGYLFKDYPTEGIIIKVNSRKLQKQLGNNQIFWNWAYAIKD